MESESDFLQIIKNLNEGPKKGDTRAALEYLQDVGTFICEFWRAFALGAYSEYLKQGRGMLRFDFRSRELSETGIDGDYVPFKNLSEEEPENCFLTDSSIKNYNAETEIIIAMRSKSGYRQVIKFGTPSGFATPFEIFHQNDRSND